MRTNRARPASSATRRVGARLVARDDERADLPLRRRLRAFAQRVPGRGDAPAVGRAREGVDGDLRVPALVQVAGERADVATAGGVVLRPDERDARRRPQALRRLAQLGRGLVPAAEGRADLRRRAGSDLHVPGGVDRDHVAAGPARGAQPEVDDRRPLDDRVVSEHEAHVGVPDGRERRAEGGQAVLPAVGQERRVGAEALAHEAGERRRLFHRLAPGERDDDGRACLAQPGLGRVERVVVRNLLEPAAAHAYERRRGSCPARSGGRTRSGPCRRASPRAPRGGCGERMRATLPSRVVAQTLQPTGQSPQTVGTFWISHGRARKR